MLTNLLEDDYTQMRSNIRTRTPTHTHTQISRPRDASAGTDLLWSSSCLRIPFSRSSLQIRLRRSVQLFAPLLLQLSHICGPGRYCLERNQSIVFLIFVFCESISIRFLRFFPKEGQLHYFEIWCAARASRQLFWLKARSTVSFSAQMFRIEFPAISWISEVW